MFVLNNLSTVHSFITRYEHAESAAKITTTFTAWDVASELVSLLRLLPLKIEQGDLKMI